jgi:hypothetical protein
VAVLVKNNKNLGLHGVLKDINGMAKQGAEGET